MYPIDMVRRQRANTLHAISQDAAQMAARHQRAAAIVAAMERDIQDRKAARRINNIILPPAAARATPNLSPRSMATWR